MASGPIRIGGVAPNTIAGAEAFQAFLRSYPQQVISDTRAELDEGADRLVAAIVERVPERTGKLKSTIRKEPGGHDLSVVVTAGGPVTTKAIGHRTYEREVRIGSDDTQNIAKQNDGKHLTYDYALGVEYGNKRMPAHPFFWPAVRDGRLKIVSAIRAGMRRRIKAAG